MLRRMVLQVDFPQVASHVLNFFPIVTEDIV